MKILLLQDDFPPENSGGAARVVFTLARGLAQADQSVTVITTTRDKLWEGKSAYEGVEVYRIYSHYPERWRAYKRLYNPSVVNGVKKIIERIQPDIIHAHNLHFYLSYYCLKIAKQARAKVFLTAHDVMLFHYGKLVEFINPQDLDSKKQYNYQVSSWQQIKRFKFRYNPFRNLIIKNYLKYVDRIFAVSNTLKTALNQNRIDNVEVVHNGISLSEWLAGDDEIRAFKNKYNFENKKTIFFGGGNNALKGGQQAILAFKKIANEIPDVVLLIAGRGRYKDQLVLQSKVNGLEGKVRFTGQLTTAEMRVAYNSADVVIMPSVCFDTFGMVLLEAMCAKKPVVASCF